MQPWATIYAIRNTQYAILANRLLPTALYICRESSTNQLLFMQNKPNFRKAKMNVNIYSTMTYEKFIPLAGQKNKPNSNPIKPNSRKAKMNVNSLITKDYRKKDDFAVRINKPNFVKGPKLTQTLFHKRIMKIKQPSGPKKQSQFKPNIRKAKMSLKSLAKKSGHTRKKGKNLDSGLSLIFLLTIFNMPCKRQRFGFPHLYLRLPVQEGPRLAGTQSTGAGKAGSL